MAQGLDVEQRRESAQQLARFARKQQLVTSGQPFDGLYTAVSVSTSGTGVIVTDPCSLAMLYRSENDDFVAFATAASLAARVVSMPRRDPSAMPWVQRGSRCSVTS